MLNKGIISDIEGVQSLGGREMSSSIKDWICVCVLVVLVVALMVAIGVVVLMVVVGLVVLVRVLCKGVVGIVEVLCIGAVEVDCPGVVDILVLGGVFVVKEVEGVELVVGCVVRHLVRLVLWCVNGRGYFLF